MRSEVIRFRKVLQKRIETVVQKASSERSFVRNIFRYMFFYKHMKFRNQARLCLAVSDFEAHIMPSLYLTFQGTGLPVWEKFNSNVAANAEYLFSDF